MGIQQIRIRASAPACVFPLITVGADVTQQFAVDVVGILAVVQACIQIYTPSGAPPCRFVSCYFVRAGTSAGKLGRIGNGKVMSRIKSDKVGLVTVFRVFVFPVMEPLLQVSVFPYAVRQEFAERLFCVFSEILIHT